jgi:hypothetical protein
VSVVVRVEDEEEEKKKSEIKRFRPKHNSIPPSRIGQEGAKSIGVQRQYRIDAPRGRVGPAKQGQGQRATKSETNEGIITYDTNDTSAWLW